MTTPAKTYTGEGAECGAPVELEHPTAYCQEHTTTAASPGPWKVEVGEVTWIEREDGGRRYLSIAGPEFHLALVQVDDDDDEQAANARLIAAAPAMLAALRKAHSVISDEWGVDHPLAREIYALVGAA